MRSLDQRDRILLSLARGESVNESITSFCAERRIPHAIVTGIGAIEDVVIGAYDLQARTYLKRELQGGWEVLALNGNFGWAERTPVLHVHATLSDMQCNVLGGHLFSARVHVTLEIALLVGTVPLQRADDAATGLKLWNLPQEVGPSPF